MQNPFHSFFRLPRRERTGFAVLMLLLLLLLAIYVLMPLFVHPPKRNEAEDKRLAAAWQAIKNTGDAEAANPEDDIAASLFAFDPNTLDSVGFRRLGLSAKAVKGLMSWRSHGKHFYKAEDLKPLYNLPPEDYERIAPYITIAGGERTPYEHKEWSSSYPAIPAIVDVNTTDTTTLDRAVRGVGATIARKIIAKRNALGGYIRFEQITEGMRLPDSTIAALREKIRIDAGRVRRIPVNTATLAHLSAHPYIGEKIAKGIVQLREGYGGKYSSMEQLRQAPLMTEEIYRKIAPYLSLE